MSRARARWKLEPTEPAPIREVAQAPEPEPAPAAPSTVTVRSRHGEQQLEPRVFAALGQPFSTPPRACEVRLVADGDLCPLCHGAASYEPARQRSGNPTLSCSSCGIAGELEPGKPAGTFIRWRRIA
jgi:hypothetical protein